MTFLDEIEINGVVSKFWEGIDPDLISNHSDKGDDGFMIILINSVKEEVRNSKIESLLLNKYLDIECLLKKLNNNFIAIYQCPVEHKVMINILKDKFQKNQSNHWKPFKIKDIRK